MKSFIFCAVLFAVSAGAAASVAAQECDRSITSPIRCGFYQEGFEDGAGDARARRASDYRRYRSKVVTQYEIFYSRGYAAGFESVMPMVRWTASQRNAYDSGYLLGLGDRRRGAREGVSGRTDGRNDQGIGRYFQQGYDDGFSNHIRRYDFALEDEHTPPDDEDPANTSGTAQWSGRVDGRANIIIKGTTIRSNDASGTGMQVEYVTMTGYLPRRTTQLTARKTSGRGEVTVIQQPRASNDYTAIVQIVDSRPGAASYDVDISWGRTMTPSVDEPYRAGSVRWRGRVDQAVNIVVKGSSVKSLDDSHTGVSGVSYDIAGSLARRSTSVAARRYSGRGTVTVLQQPSANNDYTAIVQIFDPAAGADNYEIDISW